MCKFIFKAPNSLFIALKSRQVLGKGTLMAFTTMKTTASPIIF